MQEVKPARTRVVHVGRESCEVYIGRPSRGYPEGSIFANPFRIGPDGDRATVIAKYRAHALASPAIPAALPSLKGRVLGCWCAPLACHGDVLVEMLEGAPIATGQLGLFS
jgi:hypothetical protein